MANSLVALAVQPPDVMGAFSQGQTQAARMDAAKMQRASETLQIIGSGAMYALNGDINGEVDPAKYAEVLDGLQSAGLDVSRFRDNPNFAKVAAQASVSYLDRLKMAQSERELDFLMRKFEAELQAGPKRSLMPVYATDAQGNQVLLQVGDDGTAVQTQVPDGLTITPGIKTIDTGTGTMLVNTRSGASQGVVEKDLAGAEREKAIGKAAGEAQMELGGAITKADQAIALIDQMLEHPGRATGTGLSGTIDPRNYIAGTDATNFHVMRRQLEGKAFLEAYESLKGGGQITEIEGQRATEAIARLSTAQSDEAFEAALRELREIAVIGKERARAKAAQGQSAAPVAPQDAPAEFPEITTQEQYDALPSGAVFMSGGKRYRKP